MFFKFTLIININTNKQDKLKCIKIQIVKTLDFNFNIFRFYLLVIKWNILYHYTCAIFITYF